MSLAKDEFLIRIACANCRQAEREKALRREGSMHPPNSDKGQSN
jgi:hypothetical protein